jgi:hypothetical protein
MSDTSEKTIRIDEASTTVTYIGEAAISIAESVAFWKIKKLEQVGSVLKITWADGNEQYDNVWENRAGYTYV